MEILNQWLVVHNNHWSMLIEKKTAYFVQDVVLGGVYSNCPKDKAEHLISQAKEYIHFLDFRK